MVDQGEKQQLQGWLSVNLTQRHIEIFSWMGVFEIKYSHEKHVPLLNKKMDF